MNREIFWKHLALQYRERCRVAEIDQLRSLCPHLADEALLSLLGQAKEGAKVRIAVPPLLVRGAFHILEFGRPNRGNLAGQLCTYIPDVGRTAESYEGDGGGRWKHVIDPGAPTSLQFVSEALAFARTNWGSELIVDDWRGFRKIYVMDPGAQNSEGFPPTRYVLSYTLVGEDGSTIGRITHQAEISAELCGGHATSIMREYNCARCSGGFQVDHCTGCDAKFKCDPESPISYTALPPELVQYALGLGFTFEIDPEVARNRRYFVD